MGIMGRLSRATDDGLVYHAMNRGNNRADVFAGDGDHEAFLESLRVAKGRYPFALFGYCLMSNHFHLLLKPGSGQSISRILQSLSVAHTWRYHKRHRTSGHVWQGRFKSPVIQDDDHLLVVLRYIEANPSAPVWSPTRGTTGGRAMASTGWDWLTRFWTVSPSGSTSAHPRQSVGGSGGQSCGRRRSRTN